MLGAGSKVLDGSELREMHAGLEELRRVAVSLAESMSAVSPLDSLDQRIGDVEKAEARAALPDRQLGHIRANLSGRNPRKALESSPQE